MVCLLGWSFVLACLDGVGYPVGCWCWLFCVAGLVGVGCAVGLLWLLGWLFWVALLVCGLLGQDAVCFCLLLCLWVSAFQLPPRPRHRHGPVAWARRKTSIRHKRRHEQKVNATEAASQTDYSRQRRKREETDKVRQASNHKPTHSKHFVPPRVVLALVCFCACCLFLRGLLYRIWYAEARLAQSVERKALNLVVVGSSPTVGVVACLLVARAVAR